MKYFWVWIGTNLYKLYTNGKTICYEGNGKYVVKGHHEGTIEK